MCLQSPCKLVILSCSFSKRVANSKYTFCKFIKELKVQVAERWGLIRLGCLSLATLTRPANSSALFLTRDCEPGASHLRPAAIFHAGTGSGIALAWATSSNHLALQLQHHCWCYVRSSYLPHCTVDRRFSFLLLSPLSASCKFKFPTATIKVTTGTLPSWSAPCRATLLPGRQPEQCFLHQPLPLSLAWWSFPHPDLDCFCFVGALKLCAVCVRACVFDLVLALCNDIV